MRERPIGNLPLPATSFVGRQSELETVQALLKRRRLVTLVGSGGSGKTRLALEVAGEMADEFEDGVWFLEFAPLTSGEQVARYVANTLSIKSDGEKPVLESILAALGTSRCLLLLDNCEHLLDACAELAAALLGACPNVFLLATSRELLSAPGETMLRVPSLSFPAPETRLASEVVKTDAGRLFLERAGQHQIDFRVDDQNAEVVARICARLDGIPLAIELAAAQVRTLSLREIDEGLNDCFRILTSGARTALPRHRTIRGTIEWSANLLDADLRRLLRRLSVFVGGFTLEAVDAVCGDGEPQLPGLLSLADKNLILVREPGKGERRRLLETVRQFAREDLEREGEADLVARRHRDYFQRMAADARPEKHQDSAGWLNRLNLDRDNLRSAIEWSLRQPDGLENALRTAADLGWFWYQQGHIAEGHDLLSQGLANPLEGITPDTRLDAIYTLAWLTNSQGKTQEAARRFKEMAALAIEMEDRLHEAEALNGLGLSAYHRSYEESRAYFEEALVLNRSLPDGGHGIANLNNLCLLSLSAGEYEAANRYGEQTVKIARQAGKLEVEGVALFLLAVNAEAMGEDERASQLFQEAERTQRKHGFRQRLMHTLIMQADHCMDSGDPTSARHLYREAHQICEELHATTVEHQVLCGFGACQATLSKPGEARALLTKGLMLCKTIEDRGHLARALEDASVYCGVEQRYEAAARLLGAAWRLREDHPGRIHLSTQHRFERLSRPVRENLGAAFDPLFDEGGRLGSVRAIGFALESLSEPCGTA